MEKENKNEKVSIVVSIVLCILFVPIILINSILIIKSYVIPERLPSIFGIKVVIILSDSMSPVFQRDTLVFVKETDSSSIEEGNIICYLINGTAITHRVVNIENMDGKKQYITKGDSNNIQDREPVNESQIEGVYMGKSETLGKIAIFMQSTTGMIVFIICPLLIYFIFEALYSRQEKIKEKERTKNLEEEIAKLKAEKKEQNSTLK